MARASSIDDDDLEFAELSLRCFAPESISYEQRSFGLSSAIEITETTGLDKVGIELLKQHLATLEISGEFQGELLFELQVKDGRVKQIVVDEKASTLNDKAVIKLIRQRLQTWKVPSSASEQIVIKLRINS
ncbi:after-VIT domain-containing protein [Capilliphycus salinus ALCB114379]|uniref:after-VIT domain-containing protein n=1 Tax=Capilliphycus salinus TaxID=2768948 RepID=UPI0039A5F1F0